MGVVNLFYSHRNFRYVIDETSFKFYFENMDNVCLEVVLRMFLKRNFEALIKEVKHLFIYPPRKLHNKYCYYLFFNERLFSEEVQKTFIFDIFTHWFL